MTKKVAMRGVVALAKEGKKVARLVRNVGDEKVR
jgi:hypothetical protein